MSNQTRPLWADRSRRVRLEITLIALLVVVGVSFLAGTNFRGGDSPTGEPSAADAASPPAVGQAASPGQRSTAPSFNPESSPSSGATATPTSAAQATPKANGTPKPTPRPTPRPTAKPTPTPVQTPTGLSGTQIGKHVDLTWQASGGAVTYNIYRGEGSGAITLLAKGLAKTSYRDFFKAPAGTSYSYQVSAIGSNGAESPRSRIFTITIS